MPAMRLPRAHAARPAHPRQLVYNVHAMTNDLKVAEARARFGELLDEAEQGRPVFIERRGVRFRLAAEPVEASKPPKAPLFDYVHRDVAFGQWTWNPGARGLAFAGRQKARKKR